MIKSLILALSLMISGMAHADYDFTQEEAYEVQTAGAEEVIGAILIGALIGKVIKDKKKKKQPEPVPAPVHPPVHHIEKVRIPMYGEIAKGESTIYLRSELNEMGVNLHNRRLKKVTLVAKSKRGMGEAYLQVGDNLKPVKDVLGSQNGYGFQSDVGESYNRISWKANRPSHDIWQIHMQGRIKVKAVIVELQ